MHYFLHLRHECFKSYYLTHTFLTPLYPPNLSFIPIHLLDPCFTCFNLQACVSGLFISWPVSQASSSLGLYVKPLHSQECASGLFVPSLYVAHLYLTLPAFRPLDPKACAAGLFILMLIRQPSSSPGLCVMQLHLLVCASGIFVPRPVRRASVSHTPCL